MIKQKNTSLNIALSLSVLFTMLLLAVRIAKTNEWFYIFYVWNTFLAIVPLIFSRQLLKQPTLNAKAIFFIIGWILFFPNAPYIITDLIHFDNDNIVGSIRWYDLLLVMSATWNGLILGLISLMEVEKFMSKFFQTIWLNLFVFTSLFLCGFGIYLGRFLRFNSWDILTKPYELMHASAHQALHPVENFKTWGFSFLFSVMLCIIYYTLKKLPHYFKRGNE